MVPVIPVAAIAAANQNNKKEPTVEFYNPNKYRYINYNLVIYKYYNFPMTRLFIGELPNTKLIAIPDKTLCKSYMFSFTLDIEKATLNQYLEENLERYLNSAIWQYIDEEVAKVYIDNINNEYDFCIKPGQYNCTTSIRWTVQQYTKDGVEEVLSGPFKN